MELTPCFILNFAATEYRHGATRDGITVCSVNKSKEIMSFSAVDISKRVEF